MTDSTKIESTTGKNVASGIGGAVGAYYGGYPGMMMGMALGSLLFKPNETKRKDYSNSDFKSDNSRLDPVPDVIGTDMCPGKVIYLNKDTFGTYDAGQLPSMGDSVNEAAWKAFIDMMMENKKPAYWAEFAVNFANKYLPLSEYHIGVIKFNNKPFWFWLILSDMFEMYDDPLNPYDPISILDAAQNAPGGIWNRIDIESYIGQDVNINTIMYFKGFFADFTSLSTAPTTSNVTLDLKNLAALNPNDFTIGALENFPSFYTEMNRDDVWMAPESMQGGEGLPGSTLYVNPYWNGFEWVLLPGGVYNHSVNMTTYWSCRDARNNCYVGLSGIYPIFMEGSNRKWDFCVAPYDRYEYDNDPYGTVLDYFRDNIIKPATNGENSNRFLQSTDVHDDRVYVCAYRNWENPYPDVAPTTDHHHANYGIKFDLYYHDRSSPYQEVTSVLYDYEYNVPEGSDGANPKLEFQSMQVDDTYVYIFGGRTQTDILLSDKRYIESGDNSYTKVYADFSAYPDGYWVGKYAALGQNTWRIWREIIEQTSTYIVVDREFAAFPSDFKDQNNSGSIVYLSKYPKWVAEWAYVGEGSTTTEIICNPPGYNDWWGIGVTEYTSVFFIGNWLGQVAIDNISGTVVTLSSPLTRDPIPGERICFSNLNSVDFDDDVVNPLMTEYLPLLWDLGFTDPIYGLMYIRANDIHLNEFQISHHVCWRINKNTGSIEVFNSERTTHPHRWVGPIREWTAAINVYTCATNLQAFVYSHESQYGTQMAVYSYVIDFSTGIEEKIHRRNNWAGSHSPAWCYMGCVVVKEWNFTTLQYEDVWYTILKSFDSFYTDQGEVVDWGTYILKLGQGKFSNKEIISSAITAYLGLDISRKGIQTILYRKGIATGPLNSGMYTNSFPNENQYQIGKFGINDDIYFYVNKNNQLSGGPYEMWKFKPPTEINLSGELYCIAKDGMATDEGEGVEWLAIDHEGTFIQCRYGFYGNGNGRWYMCDESPPEIINEFWDNYTDPRYFNIEMQGTLEYNDALEICNELIDTTIYNPKENINIKERRFQFSKCYHQQKKMHDVINEILATCQGFISPCNWVAETKRYKIIIPNANETPVIYFGHDSALLTSNQLSDTYNYIYADFSAYPDDYWKGDMVDFGEQMEFDNIAWPWGTYYRNWAIVLESRSTYIVIDAPLVDFYPNGKQFSLEKDNIKEGSFTFAEKPLSERPNKVRIEFRNRLLDYIKDVAEVDDYYRLEVLGEEEKIDFYEMHGIKRATQAGRLAQRILDQWNYQKYTCAFDTDIMGMTLCMGDIIGVSHDITGWNAKWFRIVTMDELMDFEVKFGLEEFNPYCYHDSGVPVINGYGYSGFPTSYVPNNVERFEVHEDIEFNRLYFTFKEPTGDGGFFIGARIYRKVGTEWEFLTIVNQTVSSVKLAQDVGINDTTIYYDADTLYGTFPSQGVIWIENELMYYHGIDTVNNAFTNVVRGYKDTDQVEHLIEDNLYITLRDDATIYYEISDSWVGTTQTFKASAFTIHSLTIAVDISPGATIDIVGYGNLPYFPESIHQPVSELPELHYLFESLGLGDSLEEIIQVIETLGLGDTKTGEVIINIFETIGLNDVTIAQTTEYLIEVLGLGDSATIKEFSLAISEDLGLGDVLFIPEIWEYITETLGLGDTNTIAEMLVAISETLGLGDDLEDVSG